MVELVLKIGLRGSLKTWDSTKRKQIIKKLQRFINENFRNTCFEDYIIYVENPYTFNHLFTSGLLIVEDKKEVNNCDIIINIQDLL